MGKVIAAFPGIGKSFFTKNNEEFNCSDSDSSNFSWEVPGIVRHNNFPANYIEHIKEMVKEKDYVFVSSHKEVRDALVAEGIDFYLVYPAIQSKRAFIQRYIDRGNNAAFVKLLEQNWEEWIRDCQSQTGCTGVALGEGLYIDTVISSIEQGIY